MILTGPRIEEEVRAGRITIDPFDSFAVGPNSVDLLLAPEIARYNRRRGTPTQPLDMRVATPTTTEEIGDDGYLLLPGVLHLARTIEVIGSDHYVPIVEGRSSVGRLGLSVHVTAGFCDTGFHGTITLEMHVIEPLRVYPRVPICQVYFLKPEGTIRLYEGRYQGQRAITASRMHRGLK